MTARPGTIPRDWPPRTGAQCRRPRSRRRRRVRDGDDRRGQGRAEPDHGDETELRDGLRSPPCCGSRAACTSWAGTSSSRRNLDTGSVARRLRKEIAEVYGHGSEVQIVASSGLHQGHAAISSGSRRTARGWPGRPACRPPWPSGPWPARTTSSAGGMLGRRSGVARRLPRARLADRAGPGLLAGDHLPCDGGGARAGRRADAGSASPSKAREVRGVDRVVGPGRRRDRRAAHPHRCARDACSRGRNGGCAARCGPPRTGWPTSTTPTCAARPGRPSPPDARVERALEILGDDAPEHLLQAGRLRLEHKQASLEELGQLPDPPMTKDAVAGRIRRLLAMADKRAAELGLPDTESVGDPRDARRSAS